MRKMIVFATVIALQACTSFHNNRVVDGVHYFDCDMRAHWRGTYVTEEAAIQGAIDRESYCKDYDGRFEVLDRVVDIKEDVIRLKLKFDTSKI